MRIVKMNPKKEGSGGVFAEPVDSATYDLFPPPLQAMVVVFPGSSPMKSGVVMYSPVPGGVPGQDLVNNTFGFHHCVRVC